MITVVRPLRNTVGLQNTTNFYLSPLDYASDFHAHCGVLSDENYEKAKRRLDAAGENAEPA